MVEFLSTRWKGVIDTELSIFLMDQERAKALKSVDESGGMLKFYNQAASCSKDGSDKSARSIDMVTTGSRQR